MNRFRSRSSPAPRGPSLSVRVVTSPGPAVLHRRALLQAAGRLCPDAPALATELVRRQRRLGTWAEEEGDQDRINEIAARLSSLIYAAFLIEDHEREGGFADDFPPG